MGRGANCSPQYRHTPLSAGRQPRSGGNWGSTAEYRYDGLNRRVRKVVSRQTCEDAQATCSLG